MNKLPLAALVLAIAFVARADTQLPQAVQDALSSIDSAPTATDLNMVLGPTAVQELVLIAQDPQADIGILLRSLHALSQYPQAVTSSTVAHDTLAAIVGNPTRRDSTAPTDILVLRAAIQSLGLLRVQGDLALLTPQCLEHPSRDVRATTATALRDLGNPAAIPLLRGRLGSETVPQVQLAISDALRVLSGP
jgi:hypothetical protein